MIDAYQWLETAQGIAFSDRARLATLMPHLLFPATREQRSIIAHPLRPTPGRLRRAHGSEIWFPQSYALLVLIYSYIAPRKEVESNIRGQYELVA